MSNPHKVYTVQELAVIARGAAPLDARRLAATLSVLVALAEHQPALLLTTLDHLTSLRPDGDPQRPS